MDSAAALTAQGFNEGKGKPFTAEDIRFARKGGILYATALGIPSGETVIRTLGGKTVTSVRLLGSNEPLEWKNGENGLHIGVPAASFNDIAPVFKIEGNIF
jgi:alpha-L-fucosidase